MEELREELEFRHLREYVEFRARQKAELASWDLEHGGSAVVIRQTVQVRAESFLRVYLSDGGRSFQEIVVSASKVGLRLEVLRKAKAALKIGSYKEHWLWYWRFPQVVEGSHEDDVSISS